MIVLEAEVADITGVILVFIVVFGAEFKRDFSILSYVSSATCFSAGLEVLLLYWSWYSVCSLLPLMLPSGVPVFGYSLW